MVGRVRAGELGWGSAQMATTHSRSRAAATRAEATPRQSHWQVWTMPRTRVRVVRTPPRRARVCGGAWRLHNGRGLMEGEITAPVRALTLLHNARALTVDNASPHCTAVCVFCSCGSCSCLVPSLCRAVRCGAMRSVCPVHVSVGLSGLTQALPDHARFGRLLARPPTRIKCVGAHATRKRTGWKRSIP